MEFGKIALNNILGISQPHPVALLLVASHFVAQMRAFEQVGQHYEIT